MNATLPASSLKDFARLLSCLARIGDEVSIECKHGKLLLSTLNQAKSAFILVTMTAVYFEKYEYVPPPIATRDDEAQLICRVQLRALLSIFRTRNLEAKDSRDGFVEKCEMKIIHPSDDITDCQLLIRLLCKQGIKKTYKLQYEQHKTLHALADRSTTLNRLTLPARAFKEVSDLFSTKAEELTLTVEDGDLLLTSFTESVVFDKEVLKQPIYTSVRIDNKEFTSIEVDEEEQITFCVREFKAVAVLCDLLNIDIEVLYGEAGRPMIVDFRKDGLTGQLIIATTVAGVRQGRKTTTANTRNSLPPQHQPRIISREQTKEDVHMDHPTSTSMPVWHDESIVMHPTARTEVENYHAPIEENSHSRGQANRDGGPLFVPDLDPETPDDVPHLIAEPLREESDPSVYRLSHSYAHEESSRPKLPEDEYGNDIMEPYEEDIDFREDDEPVGPTQPDSAKMKGIFD